MRLGVDIGGVIIEPSDDDEDTSFFGANYLRTAEVPGAFDALATIGGDIWLVSKCSEPTERRTREWLAHHDFTARTGVPAERWRFCRTRADKGPIAAELGLTHFVDDKLEVLGHLTTVGCRIWFRGTTSPPGIVRVGSWPELLECLPGLGQQ